MGKTIPVTTYNADGTVTHSSFEMGEELEKLLEEARAEYKRLREAGTPYWCIHEGRDVTHPRAQWKEDGYQRPDGIEMQYKHGVICLDCWGYIQEG